jgi:hypothetical protein
VSTIFNLALVKKTTRCWIWKVKSSRCVDLGIRAEVLTLSGKTFEIYDIHWAMSKIKHGYTTFKGNIKFCA